MLKVCTTYMNGYVNTSPHGFKFSLQLIWSDWINKQRKVHLITNINTISTALVYVLQYHTVGWKWSIFSFSQLREVTASKRKFHLSVLEVYKVCCCTLFLSLRPPPTPKNRVVRNVEILIAINSSWLIDLRNCQFISASKSLQPVRKSQRFIWWVCSCSILLKYCKRLSLP